MSYQGFQCLIRVHNNILSGFLVSYQGFSSENLIKTTGLMQLSCYFMWDVNNFKKKLFGKVNFFSPFLCPLWVPAFLKRVPFSLLEGPKRAGCPKLLGTLHFVSFIKPHKSKLGIYWLICQGENVAWHFVIFG